MKTPLRRLEIHSRFLLSVYYILEFLSATLRAEECNVCSRIPKEELSVADWKEHCINSGVDKYA